MKTSRPAILDGSNAGLLAAIFAVPLLALIVSAGPIRGFARRASAAQERQSEEIARLAERKRELRPVARSERERVDEALADFETDVASLGEYPTTRLVHDLSTLLESSGAREVRVSLAPPVPGEEPRAPLVVAALDGGRALTLVPNAVRVALRSDFAGLRSALDAMAEGGRTIQIDSAEFVRDGEAIRVDLDITFWSREGAP